MKFTAEQIEYLENNIEMDGLDIVVVRDHIQGSVWGHVLGDVEGNVYGDVEGNVFGDVLGGVWEHVLGDVEGDVWGDVGDVLEHVLGGFKNTEGTA